MIKFTTHKILRAKLDIRLYEPNKTQNLRVDLEDGAGYLMLLLTLCPYQQCNAFNQQSFAQESTLIQQIKQLPESQQQKYDSLVKNIDYFSFLDDHDFRKEIFHLNMELSERYVGQVKIFLLQLLSDYKCL